ncbi:paraquat-inducible protein B [Litchfieldella qijiaojingensis]|uniref:Paraquat-inducible protein B n=1 Tax=Litchfieldella qijiaojingensis TaxID=980347 RepID=A0ABQ2YDX6_9GAMM|nr:intermembrane transport protein PqiB [Halomonas qijiaojingensis]GGX79981.1 paraquat-inducible protein B [Halomonas qijiaojingensis]
MTDEQATTPHRASRRRQSRLSPIWIVPLVAVLIGMWLVYDNITSRGPLITLSMPNAEGIEAGSTLIKTRNVEVGRVEQVRLSDDLSHTQITARMDPDAERMLVEDTSFWVVKPRIGREGISGLGTVLSGAFIQLQPGQSDVERREFDVLEQPPVAPAGAEGIRINLVSQLGNSLRVGDPVTYQGYTVGRVEVAEFDAEAHRMRHRLFIETPYDTLITDNTRFWSASGVDLRLDSEGIHVNVESLEALLGGGVTFGYLEDIPRGAPVNPDTTFVLYADEDSARQGTFNRYLEYVLLVDDTVRGLSRGAPVEFRGVRVGTVASVPWHFRTPQPESRQRFSIPVLIRIEPQRIAGDDGNGPIDLEEWDERFKRMFGLGLRASLKSGNLLTGALFVDLNFHSDLADTYAAERFEDHTVFPTTSTGLAHIETQVTNLLNKLNALEIEPLLTRLDRNLEVSEAMLADVRQLTASFQGLLDEPGISEVPDNLNQTLKELRQTLQGFSPDSGAYRELTSALERLERVMRDLQPVARTLSEQPNALIFERRLDGDPEPRAPRP